MDMPLYLKPPHILSKINTFFLDYESCGFSFNTSIHYISLPRKPGRFKNSWQSWKNCEIGESYADPANFQTS